MRKYFLIVLCILLTIALIGCRVAPPSPTESGGTTSGTIAGTTAQIPSGTTQPTFVPTSPSTVPTESSIATEPSTQPPSEIDLLVGSMTLREKVGQLFIVTPDALETDSELKKNGVTKVSDSMRQRLEKYPVGGFILFAANIRDPQQLSALNSALQEASTIPAFICVDEEGGRVARLARNSKFDLKTYESAMAVGSSGDPGDALEMGSTIGAYLKAYGFNLDFAPVADVYTNPENKVIGNRAFSSDPHIAAEMVAAMAQGLREHGIIATFKHFPGHGDTAEDSHSGIAVNHKTLSELLACEWLPFMEATDWDLIMVGHVAVPEITGDLAPATLSYKLVTEILKDQLGFTGLVVSDSLRMGAIAGEYTPGEAALLALEAGVDILLMPSSLSSAFDAIVEAVEDGTFPTEKLDSIVKRILEFKQTHGIL